MTEDYADTDLIGMQSWDAADRDAALEFPDDHPELLFTGADMMHARAEGRREANNAITWDTTCIGCANHMDDLYAERGAGADDVIRVIVADLKAAYAETGDRALLHAVAVAIGHATRPAEMTGELTAVTTGGPALPHGAPA